MNKLYFRLVLVLAFVFTMSASNILTQDFCDGNFDYDQDVDGTDTSTFKTDFGRSAYQNPCPADAPAPVIKTGQTTIYFEGDDGYLAKGYTWPNPRFTDNEDYTVSDNLSGLMWTATADLTGIPGSWTYAMDYPLNMGCTRRAIITFGHLSNLIDLKEAGS